MPEGFTSLLAHEEAGVGTRDYSRPVRRTGHKSVVWLTTESAGALGAEPHRTHGILDWGGEYAGGEQTISRIHLTRGQGPHDEFSARDSLALGEGRLKQNMWLSKGGHHRSHCLTYSI